MTDEQMDKLAEKIAKALVQELTPVLRKLWTPPPPQVQCVQCGRWVVGPHECLGRGRRRHKPDVVGPGGWAG
jgi:hypothetical protein